MEITTLVFLAFVTLVCFFYYILPKKFQWCILLIASVLFFVSSSAFLTIYMLITTGIIYIGALIIQKDKERTAIIKKELNKEERKSFSQKAKKKQKILVALASCLVLALLVLLKYGNLLGEIGNSIFELFGFESIIPQFKILLPIGISYYTLMAVSYVVDVYRGIIPAEKNPFRVLLFVCYFPHIIEGPFDRYKDLDEQFKLGHSFDYEKFTGSIVLILFGLFKKLVIADRIGFLVGDYFGNVSESSMIGLILATLMFTIQLFADFSGCIDVVSGVSGLFGIKIAKNFRQPFFAKSINEFWRRWHITLGLWLKEYVFYPVTLSGHFKKVNKFVKDHSKNATLISFIPVAYSLFFVWFCNGLWHGASVKYIIYGLYYYVLMMIGTLFAQPFEKVKAKLKIKNDNKMFSLFQMLRTFIIVNIGMLLFRADTLTAFLNYIKSALFTINGADISWLIPERFDLLVLVIAISVVFAVEVIKEKGTDIIELLNTKLFVFKWTIAILLLISILLLGAFGVEYGEAAAIYAQF